MLKTDSDYWVGLGSAAGLRGSKESRGDGDSCHFNAISTPFQRHFNAISTPFQRHFNAISNSIQTRFTPFEADERHFNAILTQL